MPIGTSTRPVLTTRPARAKTLVPLLLLSVAPMLEYDSAPLRMIQGTLA